MATRRMLVDAIHPEETRIVVTNGNRLEEFDFESASRRQLRGNIYLAKVTRVEPSLQAAFVEYGGNRHGFLAFSEIHPDYYQIPVADREALLREDEESTDESADLDEAGADEPSEGGDSEVQSAPQAGASAEDDHEDEGEHSHIEQAPANTEPVENVGGADVMEEVPRAPKRRQQRYKIQEVIKRRQVMLVQVVKEERGNKGAALTTYLSLAGRYSVLMPNTARGGGISRKITNAADRKRLKEITADLDVPPGMGVILRTAGATRTKAEVKRDFEYLLRLWENVRSLTLRSQAPCLVYEEGSLIKRTIRDLYSKEIEEVFVAGESAFREAHDFMNMIMPSAAKNVQLYQGDQPLFSKYGIESQLDQMFSPQVTLPSGGYIVINPTEALVSIDVNSGRATKEHNIEDTALQTNLEAAEEISRQLRLRDLAGLIVIDFIDMMENRSNRAVERKLKDCLKNDRARIQVGRISHFGLMEMSRQRIRFGVIESSTHTCPVCAGTGLIRSVESLALMIMRHVEDHVMRRVGQSINVRVPTDVALYILNAKRNTLSSLEAKNALSITIVADSKMTGTQFAIEKGELRISPASEKPPEHVRVDTASFEDDADADLADEEQDEAGETEEVLASSESEPSRRNRRNRRRRGGNRGDEATQRTLEFAAEAPVESVESEEVEDEESELEPGSAEALSENGEPRRRRRRGRRGGRRNRRFGEEGVEQPLDQQPAAPVLADADVATPDEDVPADTSDQDAALMATQPPVEAATDAEPAAATLDASAPVLDTPPVPEAAEAEASEPVAKPKRTRRRKTDAEAPVVPEPSAEPVEASEDKPKRKPRTRRAKAEAADTDTMAVSEAAAASEATAISEVPAPAQSEPVAVDVETGSAPDAASMDSADGEAESSRRRRVLPPEEGVIVTSSAAPTAEAEPKKKAGWWQRRLGLG